MTELTPEYTHTDIGFQFENPTFLNIYRFCREFLKAGSQWSCSHLIPGDLKVYLLFFMITLGKSGI